MYFGEILGFSIGGGLLSGPGYDWIFYFFGILGLVWFPVWWYMAYETPQVHPHISAEEIILFEKGMFKFLNANLILSAVAV